MASHLTKSLLKGLSSQNLLWGHMTEAPFLWSGGFLDWQIWTYPDVTTTIISRLKFQSVEKSKPTSWWSSGGDIRWRCSIVCPVQTEHTSESKFCTRESNFAGTSVAMFNWMFTCSAEDLYRRDELDWVCLDRRWCGGGGGGILAQTYDAMQITYIWVNKPLEHRGRSPIRPAIAAPEHQSAGRWKRSIGHLQATTGEKRTV